MLVWSPEDPSLCVSSDSSATGICGYSSATFLSLSIQPCPSSSIRFFQIILSDYFLIENLLVRVTGLVLVHDACRMLPSSQSILGDDVT